MTTRAVATTKPHCRYPVGLGTSVCFIVRAHVRCMPMQGIRARSMYFVVSEAEKERELIIGPGKKGVPHLKGHID